MKRYRFKKDKYRSSRGGYSRLLEISCRECGKTLLLYQKDGPGNLRRLYLDRIFDPPEIVNLQALVLKDIPKLRCKYCGDHLGTPYVFSKEKRKAFRLFQDAVTKKIKRLY